MVADHSSRVLIADGDPALRQRLFGRLVDLEITSDCVASGQDALEKLSEVAYTVVVLDLALPGVDAVQVLGRLAQLPSRPVVLVTAEEQAARVFDLEIVQIVLRKPLNVDQLAELVRNCVRTVANRRTINAPSPGKGPETLRP
jgi:two-component system, OmpR family, response regulator